ncbi:unnamed protein product [Camellia sinensis]
MLFLLLGVVMPAIPISYGLSVSCMAVYDEGSTPAVFRSPECPDWVLSPKSHQNQIMNCQFATTPGRRKYQEDRFSCKNGPKDVRLGVVAVFDGHIEDNMVFQNNYEDELGRHSSEGIVPVILDGSTHMGILKQALERTIYDIDSTFPEARSTAVIALPVDGQILVANVGESKALLCSEKLHPHHEADGTLKAHLASKELTRDHNLHTKDERARIEAAGGDITEWNPPLINGHFPMTPAIGDVPIKMYLVVASDGIFESLEPKDVCDLLQDAHFQGNKKSKQKSSCLLLSSLADCIVHNAFEKGSTDNLFAVVVPLMSVGFNTRTLVGKEVSGVALILLL